MDALVPLLSLVAVVGIVYAGIYFSRISKKAQDERQAIAAKQLEKQMAETQAIIDRMEAVDGDITKLPNLRGQVDGLIFHETEHCFAVCKGAQHVALAHKTKFVGGSHGVSFRVTKGVRYRVGAFSGHPVVTDYEKVQDTGTLCVTNERVVFAGGREVTSILGKKVADIQIEGDHIWVLAENRKTPLGLKLTEQLAPVMAYAIRLLAETSQGKATGSADDTKKPVKKGQLSIQERDPAIAYFTFSCAMDAQSCEACRALDGFCFLPSKTSQYTVPVPGCKNKACSCQIFGVYGDESDAADIADFLRRSGGAASSAQIEGKDK